MRKIFLFIISLALLSCSRSEHQPEGDIITVSIRPQKYIVEQIAGNRFKINILVPDGSGPETYEPTSRQMQEMRKSSAWFTMDLMDFERSLVPKLRDLYPDLKIVNVSDGIEFIAGHQHYHPENESHEGHNHESHVDEDFNHEGHIDEGHNHEGHIDEGHNHEGHIDEGHNHEGHSQETSGTETHESRDINQNPLSIDPHIWLSFTTVKVQSKNILNYLITNYPSEKHQFIKNYNTFIHRIDSLHNTIERMFGDEEHSFIIYHPSLSYFAKDYDIEQISIELEGKEPSPAHMKQIIDAAKERNIGTIFYSEQFDKRSALTISKQLGVSATPFNPLLENIEENLINIANQINRQK